jgi:hypothetical protein
MPQAAPSLAATGCVLEEIACYHPIFLTKKSSFQAITRVYYTLVFSVIHILQMFAHAAVNAGFSERECFLTLL